jgi:4-hydroxy-3-polyprenylbenzoate decarboxylase
MFLDAQNPTILKYLTRKKSRNVTPISSISDNRSVAANNASSTHNLTLAITGASGSIYASEMLRALVADTRVANINLVVSDNALRVMAEELHLSGRNNLVEKLLGASSEKVHQHAEVDIAASIASGSYPSSGMIVLPCSMGTLAAIANGLASNLIQRAADVCLKEKRPLILCVRETPFNRIHLRNMQLAADAGATIFPAIPTLYNHPQSTTEMAREFVNRVLAHIGLPQPGAYQWHAD